jgi:hypothetical protein
MDVERPASGYPIEFDVDYPDRDLNRLTTAFRIFTAIPILIVLGVIGDTTFNYTTGDNTRWISSGSGGILFLPALLLIVFREKYPRWWFDFNYELLRFQNRVTSYLALLRDEYPSTDEEQAVHLTLPYPDVPRDLNRYAPLYKWFLAIPHYIVLIFLTIAAVVVVIVAWFAILFTGRYPRGIFDFVVGVMRWGNRVAGYAFVLVTDQYPPFRLAP